MTSGPWLVGDASSANPGDGDRRHAPATLRNRGAILDILRDELGGARHVLEIASGSGEHALYFADTLSDVRWQPSDCEAAALASISAYARDARHGNILPPLLLDMGDADWAEALLNRIDAIVCCNMVHIAPWSAAEGLFGGGATLLPPGAPLILYGPFIETGVETAPGNIAFDASLRARDAAWGLREVDALDALAQSAGFTRTARHAMPANNLTLVWRRT